MTWEETGKDWVGLKFNQNTIWYTLCRFFHQLQFPSHPDYNGGDY